MNYDIEQLNKDLDELDRQIEELKFEAGVPGLWDNQEYAQKVSRNLNAALSKHDRLYNIKTRLNDLDLMTEWSILGEISQKELDEYVRELDERWTQYLNEKLFKGKYDEENAILTLHSGEGGDEAEDWTDMMLRALIRWCESHNWKVKLNDIQRGKIGGIKSVEVIVEGEKAYGYCRVLAGIYRLVRISPFDAAGRRHTSFMAIDVIPELNEVPDIEINPDDIILETMTAHVKAGGQSMQHNNTGIRITHKPSGIVIRYDVERSQLQNRNAAMEMLKNRLAAIEEQKRLDEINGIRGVKSENGWGGSSCSIVLMPYQLVKDTRSNWESSNTTAFLNGEWDKWIHSLLEVQNGSAQSS